jgi:murein DD-endopeptidase / murein LD-carboxypeptidase
MKLRVLFIFLFLPFLTFAQAQSNRSKNKVKKQSIEEYYASHQLVPDSACSPYLYYQVYDWVGTRYKYAGRTKKGIDCSGFVCEMYINTYCVSLSGGSLDLWPNMVPVEKEELQEGDILFFKIKKGQISHVGIYLGNNKFAHASVHSGVIVSDLEEEYYKKYFYKGGRVKEAIEQ